MNQLDNLKKFSTIVVDTGNIEAIQKYTPQDATTNPSLILQAILSNKNYQKFLNDAILYAQKKGGNKKNKIINANNKLSVSIGSEILKQIPGSVSTEIDARSSYSQELSIQYATKLINMYKEENIDTNRILIKIAATWEGIKAATELKKYGIKCNLTLLFSFAQAKACAESGVYLISPFVGRIYDWYHKKNLLVKPYNSNTDPGVQAIHKIFQFYKTHNYKTIIMAASFRNVDQIIALAGCDRLTISPNLLKILHENKQTCNIKQKLFLPSQTIINQQKILSKEKFQKEHNKDIMAVEKLNEGIYQFSQDQKKLDSLLINLL